MGSITMLLHAFQKTRLDAPTYTLHFG